MNAHAAHSSAQLEHLHARFAQHMAAALTEVSRTPDHAVSERLRVAREQAVARARAARQLQAEPSVHVSGAGAGVISGWFGGGPRAWLPRLGMVLPAAMLAVGLFAIDQQHDQAQIDATADVDLALLSDDVPPAAYSDAGFGEYLRANGVTATR